MIGSKKTVHLIGSLAAVGSFAASWFLLISPNLDSADEYNKQAFEVSNEYQASQVMLTQYQNAANEPAELENELADLRAQIPALADAGDVQRQIVQNLGSNISLISFSHGATGQFEQPEGNPISLTPPEIPFELDADRSGDSGLQMIPFELRVESASLSSLMSFLDNIEEDGRIIIVSRVYANITEEDSSQPGSSSKVEATIHAYSFFEE